MDGDVAEPWKPEDIALVFVTCPREPAYLPATLASALLGDPLAVRLREIAVAVDAPDLGCVHPLAGNRRVRWVARTEEESARADSYHLHRRACHNYWRALGLASPGARAVLVCEDDVIFRDGWLGMLLECLDEMQSAGLRDFLLTAYSARDHEEAGLRRGRCYSSYVASTFFGTQAMLFPTGQIQSVSELIWQHGVIVAEAPYDLLIKRQAIERQHLYTTRHSLVQHVGSESTGLGDGRHRSPSFEREWPQPGICHSETKPEFGVVMTIVERPDQVEWAIQRLRANHADAPFTLISDGRHEERYARIAEVYGGEYVKGEKLKTPERGAEWWQRTLEAGLAFGTPYFLKMDPDASFNRPIAQWPEFDCFGTVNCLGSDREHVQGGVQGFRRTAAEKIVGSGICLRPEFREVEYWAWDKAAIPGWKKARYLSTDMTLRRILIESGIQWGDWPEVKSWFDSKPPDYAKYAVSHAHKWMELEERKT